MLQRDVHGSGDEDDEYGCQDDVSEGHGVHEGTWEPGDKWHAPGDVPDPETLESPGMTFPAIGRAKSFIRYTGSET